jgi:Fe2+ or Zn2+ uptake regulation protein
VECLEKYVKLLKENDLKVTPQRLAILEYLDYHRKHPTADNIYCSIKKNNPSLSKTTVYNALEILEKYGLILSINIGSSEHRYDFRNDSHHHFFCKECRNIIDIDIKCPNMETILSYGHKVDEIHGYFKGICKDCLKKKKEGS